MSAKAATATTPVLATTAARPAKLAPRPQSSIQSFPFKDPDFDEAIGLMTKGLHLLKTSDYDEAKGHFEQAIEIFNIVVTKDYPILIKILPPNKTKRQESIKKAEATKLAAKTNLDRCTKQIETLNSPLKLKAAETNAKLEAGILASIFGREGLRSPEYEKDRNRVFTELGVVEDLTYREKLITSAQTVAEVVERSELVLMPDDVLVLSDHGINNDSLKLHDKTVAQWKTTLIQKLQQPEEESPKQKPRNRNRRGTNKLALSIVTPDGKDLGTVVTQLADPGNQTAIEIELPPVQKNPSAPPKVATVEAFGSYTIGDGTNPALYAPHLPTDPARNIFEATQISDSEQPFIGASAVSDETNETDETLPEPKPENILATLLGEIYVATAVKKEEPKRPKAVLTDIDSKLETYGIPKNDQAFYLIKALVDDNVIISEDELRTIALIAVKDDLAIAARSRHFIHSEFDDVVINVLSGFNPLKNLATAQWGKIFCEYIESSYSSKFNTWYDRYHAESIRSITEAALGTKMSGTSGKRTIDAVDQSNVIIKIFKLLDLACEEGVITETERKAVKTLLHNYDEFQAFLEQIETKKDQGKINQKISEIKDKIERNYCGLAAKVKLHLIENGQHKQYLAPLPSDCLSNIRTWLDLKNEYFQIYLDSKSNLGKRGVDFDIKPPQPSVTPDPSSVASTTPAPPPPLKQITLDNWKSIQFSHESQNESKFFIAYFGLLEKGQLPTIETICKHTGFTQKGFNEFKQELLDPGFKKEGYLPLPLFNESQSEIANIYFSYRKFKKEHETEDFTLDKLLELLSSKEKNQLYSDIKERDFSQVILIDPLFSDVLIYLQIGVEDCEKAQRLAKEDAELAVLLATEEAKVGTIIEVEVKEEPVVSSLFIDKIREAVEANSTENGEPLTIDELLKEFDKLPMGIRQKSLRFYTAMNSGFFPVELRHPNGTVEIRNINKDEYRKLVS